MKANRDRAQEYFVKHFMEEGYTKARLDKRRIVNYRDMGELRAARVAQYSSSLFTPNLNPTHSHLDLESPTTPPPSLYRQSRNRNRRDRRNHPGIQTDSVM
jgi:hypothetical protein